MVFYDKDKKISKVTLNEESQVMKYDKIFEGEKDIEVKIPFTESE